MAMVDHDAIRAKAEDPARPANEVRLQTYFRVGNKEDG